MSSYASVTDLWLVDFHTGRNTNGSSGGLFDCCFNCTFTNIHLTASNPSKPNELMGVGQVGALMAQGGGNVTNCTLQYTFIQGCAGSERRSRRLRWFRHNSNKNDKLSQLGIYECTEYHNSRWVTNSFSNIFHQIKLKILLNRKLGTSRRSGWRCF